MPPPVTGAGAPGAASALASRAVSISTATTAVAVAPSSSCRSTRYDRVHAPGAASTCLRAAGSAPPIWSIAASSASLRARSSAWLRAFRLSASPEMAA